MAEFTDRSIIELMNDRMQSIKRTEPCPKDLTDEESALDQVAEEATAAMKYKVAARHAEDPHTKAVFESNADEELVHIGEDEEVAEKQNKRVRKKIDEGRREAEEIGTTGESITRALNPILNRTDNNRLGGQLGDMSVNAGRDGMSNELYALFLKRLAQEEAADRYAGKTQGRKLGMSGWQTGNYLAKNRIGNLLPGGFDKFLQSLVSGDRQRIGELSEEELSGGAPVSSGSPEFRLAMGKNDMTQYGGMMNDIIKAIETLNTNKTQMKDPNDWPILKKAFLDQLVRISQEYLAGGYGATSANVPKEDDLGSRFNGNGQKAPLGIRTILPHEAEYNRSDDEDEATKKENDEKYRAFVNRPENLFNLDYYNPNIRALEAYLDVLNNMKLQSVDLGLSNIVPDSEDPEKEAFQNTELGDIIDQEAQNTLKAIRRLNSTHFANRAYNEMLEAKKNGTVPKFLGLDENGMPISPTPRSERKMPLYGEKGLQVIGNTYPKDSDVAKAVRELMQGTRYDEHLSKGLDFANEGLWAEAGGVDEDMLNELRDAWARLGKNQFPRGVKSSYATPSNIAQKIMKNSYAPRIHNSVQGGGLATLMYLAQEAGLDLGLKPGEAIDPHKVIPYNPTEKDIDKMTDMVLVQNIKKMAAGENPNFASLPEKEQQNAANIKWRALSDEEKNRLYNEAREAAEAIYSEDAYFNQQFGKKGIVDAIKKGDWYKSDPHNVDVLNQLLRAAGQGVIKEQTQDPGQATELNLWNDPSYKDIQAKMRRFEQPPNVKDMGLDQLKDEAVDEWINSLTSEDYDTLGKEADDEKDEYWDERRARTIGGGDGELGELGEAVMAAAEKRPYFIAKLLGRDASNHGYQTSELLSQNLINARDLLDGRHLEKVLNGKEWEQYKKYKQTLDNGGTLDEEAQDVFDFYDPRAKALSTFYAFDPKTGKYTPKTGYDFKSPVDETKFGDAIFMQETDPVTKKTRLVPGLNEEFLKSFDGDENVAEAKQNYLDAIELYNGGVIKNIDEVRDAFRELQDLVKGGGRRNVLNWIRRKVADDLSTVTKDSFRTYYTSPFETRDRDSVLGRLNTAKAVHNKLNIKDQIVDYYRAIDGTLDPKSAASYIRVPNPDFDPSREENSTDNRRMILPSTKQLKEEAIRAQKFVDSLTEPGSTVDPSTFKFFGWEDREAAEKAAKAKAAAGGTPAGATPAGEVPLDDITELEDAEAAEKAAEQKNPITRSISDMMADRIKEKYPKY